VALTHLVDTSVLTRLGYSVVRTALEPFAATGQVARAGISDLEIGFSARNLIEWNRLATALAAFPLIETDARHVRRARQVQRLLASRGFVGAKFRTSSSRPRPKTTALPCSTTMRTSTSSPA
jgi:predicted nucleic acid-binding protein